MSTDNPDTNDSAAIGYVDGSSDSTTQRFTVVLEDDAFVQLDDLVVCEQPLPGDRGTLIHYGIVVENTNTIEGADLPSDTRRIFGEVQTMPGERSRTISVQVLRSHPELWLSPSPGTTVRIARADDRKLALFQDRMDGGELYVGLDHGGEPVPIDWSFLNGEKGAHLSISGISGVATKTSYALFTLYMLMETRQGRGLLHGNASGTKAIVFNVKGQDLLHLDRKNTKFSDEARAQWAALGVTDPRPFGNVGIFVPPRKAVRADGVPVAHVPGRKDGESTIYGWTPYEFITKGLLPFVFSDARPDRQLSFVVEHVRLQLAKCVIASSTIPGAVFLSRQPIHRGSDFDQVVASISSGAGGGGDVSHEIDSFADLVAAIDDRVRNEPGWTPGTTEGTNSAFLRRLWAMNRRLGQLVMTGVRPLDLTKNINVIDINSLHDDAQRFVVGAVLDALWNEKQSGGREPLRFVVLDELNKYAPAEGSSPIKEILVDIAARGRSLGVILIGCQQNAGRVDDAIVDNAAIKVVGRLDASHADDYRFLSPELRGRATRFLPGTMVLHQPSVPAPIPITFPFPPYATNRMEAGNTVDDADVDALIANI